MNEIVKTLKIIYWFMVTMTLAMALVFEYIVEDTVGMEADPTFEYVWQSIAVLISLGGLVLALRLFKIKAVEQQIKEKPLTHYMTMSKVRFALIEGITLFNLVGYFLFINPSFVWLALITGMGFFFIYPSKERLINETGYMEE
ncbi:MAG: hypothetical protein J6I52_06685 [Prevotella sp.]|nr:hypothetical protein [Prevotella sp.]